MIDAWTKRSGVLYLSAGAATRNEFNEPYMPAFAAGRWADPAHLLQQEGHSFNERTDLPGLKPMTFASVQLGGASFKLPVLGCRLDIRDPVDQARIAGGYVVLCPVQMEPTQCRKPVHDDLNTLSVLLRALVGGIGTFADEPLQSESCCGTTKAATKL